MRGLTRRAKAHWQQSVTEVQAAQVEQYYDTGDEHIEELMWWHTLRDDNSPLAYVAAVEFASAFDCKSYLDFGAGVGSGGLLFQHHGFDVTMADISGVLQSFCKYRMRERGRDATFIDLKASPLPRETFDFVTTMDVFEHLVDPVGVVDSIARSLKPGGYIYGRFAAEDDPDRPQHIVTDFTPVFDRFAQLGIKEVFRDDWLWGHQVFQKAR
jgi:2-polyprenyl-3-methyl-5-hydroxy-6-metoxy-1,4-benzoquinol methylase